MGRYENPQRKNKIDIPSFKDFHAQIASLRTIIKIKNTANTRIIYEVQSSKTKQNKTEIMKNITKLA